MYREEVGLVPNGSNSNFQNVINLILLQENTA